jgi:hypothetical protein
MKTPLDMREFARLNQLWLDGRATAEEAARHWQMVAEHAECARELAAAARFEALLEKKLSEASEEMKAAVVLATASVRREEVRRVTNWRNGVRPLAKMAALIAVAGLLWWVLGREGWDSRPEQEVVSRRVRGPEVRPKGVLPVEREAKPDVVPGVVAAGATEWTVESLRTWLDGYFLRGVDLKQVPLKEALGRLQADMMAVNFMGAEVVGRLRVTVSADAAGRRVSLKTGSISFLKAIEALAMQAGCEVEVGDLLLALQSKAQPFPQPTARHDLREVLAGRFDANGVSEADRPDLMAKVWEDAVAQGFVAADAVGGGPVRLTQGQVDTLRGLAEARGQVEQLPVQQYQMRLVAGGAFVPGQVLNEGEVKQILAQPANEGSVKVVVVKPGQRVAIDQGNAVAGSGMEFEVMPVGQGWQVGFFVGRGPSSLVPLSVGRLSGGGAIVQDATRPLNSNPVMAAAAVLVSSGQGAVMTMAMGDAVSKGADGGLRFTVSDAASTSLQVSGGVTAMTNSVGSSQVLLLPMDPPEGTAP